MSGKCQNSSYEVYNKKVDCQIVLGIFDLVRDSDKAKCRMCHGENEPITWSFCECQYRLKERKKEKGKTKKEFVKADWKRVEKDY